MRTEQLPPPNSPRKTLDSHPAPAPAWSPNPVRLTRLLVPLDFSPGSRRALDYAVALAERSGAASLHLVHVVEPYPEYVAGDLGPILVPDEEAAGLLEHELARVAKETASPAVPISSAVHGGRPAARLIALAQETGADLVVIATHGRTGLKHLLLGSVAERVVREARCPVLVVREPATPGSFGPAPVRLRRILVPTDFSPASGETLRYAVGFARLVGGRITLCHCVHLGGIIATPEIPNSTSQVLLETLRDSAESRLKDLLRLSIPAELASGTAVRIGPPLAEIPELAQSGAFDLIICATHGYTGLKHMLLGSTAEGIVRHAQCPVLVTHKPSAGQRFDGDRTP